MEMQKQRTCIAKEVQIVEIITIVQIQGNTEMQFMRRARAVAVAHRGTAITLTFLTRAILSSYAEAITIVVRMQACSISTTTVVVATATGRSVRSWSHFNVTLSLALCKSAENIKCHPMQITGSENEMEVSYKKVLQSKTFFDIIQKGLNYYSNFPNTSNPFFKRGGNYNNGTNAGVFYFNNNNGNSNSNNSFRPVLVALRYNEKFKRRIFLLIKYVYGHILGSIKEV